MFASTKAVLLAAMAMLAVPAAAEFTSVCPEICFRGESFLVTKCTVDQTPNDDQFKWSQFDLNQILQYNSGLPGLEYKAYGDAFADGCDGCSMSGSILTCNCGTIDLNTYMSDAVGRLCFINNEIGPLCSPDTTYTC